MSGESILVVEDDGVAALHLRELLEKRKYRVSGTAAYGEDALKMADKDPPDLVFMDIGLMGKIDGIETARRILERSDVPIIYLSGYADSQRLARAKETAPYGYIVKPYNEDELVAAIEIALRRKTTDRQLRETMQRYRAIVDNAVESILLISPDTGKIIEANPAFTRLLGYSSNEIVNLVAGDIIYNGKKAGLPVAVISSTGSWPVETQFRCRDGTLKDIEMNTSIIDSDGGQLACMIAHDVTDRKHVEAALREAHRKLNLLSGITRHDILNQLTILYGYLEISQAAATDARNIEYVEKEKKAAIAIRRLISFTKEYEEIGQQSPLWQKPHAIIVRLAKTIGPEVSISDRLGDTEVFADPLLERVFHNLLDNTVRHGKHAKNVTVTSEPTGQELLIRWQDDGEGVPDADKERIFERGFGKHTGLGLFLAREILSLTGITIQENGTFGAGARFEMMVPAGAFRQGSFGPQFT
jgi:PAS domain S-box-containing protein